MEWGNLILCGGVCNKSKLNHDTLKYPVINPFRDNPNDFLYFENYRYKEKNKMGHDTIDILDLNNWEYFIKPRAKIGNKVQETLSELRESLDDLTDDRKRRRFIRKFKNLLSEGGRKEPYSALISTIILSDSNFEKIKNTISVNKLWDQDLEDLKDDLKYCALLK
jgi:hypothetical protein